MCSFRDYNNIIGTLSNDEGYARDEVLVLYFLYFAFESRSCIDLSGAPSCLRTYSSSMCRENPPKGRVTSGQKASTKII